MLQVHVHVYSQNIRLQTCCKLYTDLVQPFDSRPPDHQTALGPAVSHTHSCQGRDKVDPAVLHMLPREVGLRLDMVTLFANKNEP